MREQNGHRKLGLQALIGAAGIAVLRMMIEARSTPNPMWGLNGPAYGSQGWGCESLRAHSLTASNNDSRGTVEYTARASLVVMLAIGNEVAECAFPAASFDEVTRFIVATDADETTG